MDKQFKSMQIEKCILCAVKTKLLAVCWVKETSIILFNSIFFLINHRLRN